MKLGTPIRNREFRLGNAVIRSRTFGEVAHVAMYSYPKYGIGIRTMTQQTHQC